MKIEGTFAISGEPQSSRRLGLSSTGTRPGFRAPGIAYVQSAIIDEDVHLVRSRDSSFPHAIPVTRDADGTFVAKDPKWNIHVYGETMGELDQMLREWIAEAWFAYVLEDDEKLDARCRMLKRMYRESFVEVWSRDGQG